MIFTAVALLAAIGSVSASSDAPINQNLPYSITEADRPGCFNVSLESDVGPTSGIVCGPHEPVVQAEPKGCFTFTTKDGATVLCRDGTASSSFSPVIISKRYVRAPPKKTVRPQPKGYVRAQPKRPAPPQTKRPAPPQTKRSAPPQPKRYVRAPPKRKTSSTGGRKN